MLKKIKRINFIDYFYNISLLILIFIFITCFISSLGFLFHITITKFHMLFSLSISYLIYNIIAKKSKNSKINNSICILLSFVFLMVIAVIISNLYMDISYDGVWYHLRCIIKLKDGWNPIYESINTGNWGDIFMDSYPCKASWIFGANIFALTNNINSTKILSILLSFCTFSISLKFFNQILKCKYKNILITIISLIICLNPIFISQVFTNYLDASLGLMLTIYFIVLAGYYFNFFDNKDIYFKVIIIILIALMMNMKLTGLFYAAIFYILFYIICYKKILKLNLLKEFKTIFFTGLFGVLTGIIIGINPYITNVLNGNNPFYPIIGDNKIEVMGENVPKSIREKTNLEKLLVVNLSNTTNSINPYDYNFKNPLSVTTNELDSIQHDTKVGGFGPLFPLVIYISCIGIVILLYEYYKNNLSLVQKKINILSILVLIVALFFSESWWARYFIILWLVPIFTFVSLIIDNKRAKRIVGYLIVFVMIINIFLVSKATYNRQTIFSKPIMNYIDKIPKNNSIEYTVTDPNFIFTYEEYFKNKNINANFVNHKIDEECDFKGINICIKEVDKNELQK